MNEGPPTNPLEYQPQQRQFSRGSFATIFPLCTGAAFFVTLLVMIGFMMRENPNMPNDFSTSSWIGICLLFPGVPLTIAGFVIAVVSLIQQRRVTPLLITGIVLNALPSVALLGLIAMSLLR